MHDKTCHLFGVGLNDPLTDTLKSSGQCHAITTLQINSPGSKRRLCDVDASGISGCPSSSSDSNKKSSATACTLTLSKEIDEGSSMDPGVKFDLNLGNENTASTKILSLSAPNTSDIGPNFDIQLSLSVGPFESVITAVAPVSGFHQVSENSIAVSQISTVDEGSICNDKACSFFSNQLIAQPTTVLPQFSSSTVIQTQKRSIASTSGVIQSQKRSSNTKNCQVPECTKGARGASGLCISHGGGRRCQKDGCHKGAEGRTIFCKAHGGGRRCQHLGCMKSAEGRTEFCIAHGGGRRCTHEGCTKAARGKSGLCIRHGGGKRCQKENCNKSAEGQSGLCISHGGGRRCKYPECTKGAQGSTNFCKAHGGGKRCTYLGCTKGAEGSTLFCKAHGGGKRCTFQGGCTKSVHGGTQFCVAHGGGKRCAAPGCTKSARGSTNFCVRHGGGKRCKIEGCRKSAQGRTDFCKAHGGGKRCSWGHPGLNPGACDRPCDRFARGKKGLCAAHSPLVEDHCVRGGHTLLVAKSEYQTLKKSEKMKEIVGLDRFSEIEKGKSILFFWGDHDQKGYFRPTSSPAHEGRVHGGSLMPFLSSGASLDCQSKNQVDAGTSDELKS
ncbi:hypothetical protein Cni_G05910 [Canna indica]|uniref:WRKY19-like zinc finger domain-containing protein n=1 Tax=Canna indica TaxID=4628 RepID=A0AAQ3JY31_9LILI|nr:hypothetical protein Cni_G05910 [Canna indica]